MALNVVFWVNFVTEGGKNHICMHPLGIFSQLMS